MPDNPERDGDIASGHGTADPTHITDSAAADMIRKQQAEAHQVEPDADDTALDAPSSPLGGYAAITEAGGVLDQGQALGTSGQDTSQDAAGGGGGSGW